MNISLIKKASDLYEEHGLNALCGRIAKKALRVFFDTNAAVWYKRLLHFPPQNVAVNIPARIHFSDFNETLSWITQQNTSWMLNSSELAIAKTEGHIWANIKCKGSIVGYIKCGFKNVYINDYKEVIKFPPKIAFIYDTFILPEHRGARLATYLINETCTFVRNKGFTSVMCHIPHWNIASKKAYSRVGFTRITTVRWLKILPFRILLPNPASFFT